MSTAYGEVLFKAWRELVDMSSSGGDSALQAHFEEMLQGLAHDCIHAADPSYFRGLRFALGAFHDSKRIKGVDALLLRMYGPILFRSLRCANAVVRAQATMVFFDAFPLQDTEASSVESDVVLQRQFDLLSSLLKDDDQRVRAAAASGVCHVLREYWEALPSNTTHRILTYVVGTLGLDSSSPSVRLAVISGLGQVLDQPLAHGVLKGLLPLLCNALHDKSQAVRLEFVRVLNKVKNIKGIHFYQIVSVEHLQRRLAADANRPSIRNAITELLLNSYYPQQHAGNSGSAANNQNQVRRCLHFVRENLPASIAFYTTFHKFTSVGSASKLLTMLLALFSSPASVWLENGGADESSSSAAALATEALQVAVLRVMSACFDSIKHALASAENVQSKDLLLKYFAPETVASISTTFCDADSEGFNVAALPVFVRIVAAVWKLRGDATDHCDIVGVVGESTISRLLQRCSASGSSATLHAMAVAELCGSQASGRSPAALMAVEEAFRRFNAHVLAHETAANGGAALSLGAAVTLMGAVVCAVEPAHGVFAGRTFAQLRSIVDGVFALTPELAKELLASPSHDNEEGDTVGTSLVRGVHLWATHALRLATDSDAPNAGTDSLNEVVAWATTTVIPACGTSAVATSMLSAVVLVLSDALLLGAVRGALIAGVGILLQGLGGGNGRLETSVMHRFHSLLQRHVALCDDAAVKGLDATVRGLLEGSAEAVMQ